MNNNNVLEAPKKDGLFVFSCKRAHTKKGIFAKLFSYSRLSKFVNIVFPCEIMAVILTADMFLSVLIFNSALLLNTWIKLFF